MVCLGPAEFCSERAERIGSDGALGLSSREAAATKKGSPPVVLRGAGDGLVLGSKLGYRSPCLLLRADRLVGRALRADMPEDATKARFVRSHSGRWQGSESSGRRLDGR